MSIHSAGILLYRFAEGRLEVMLVHPGGPYWAKKDEHAWTIPKGLCEPDETPLDAARREFREETGFEAIGEFIELGQLKQPSRKIVHAWAVEQDVDTSRLVSNSFDLEWPRNSGVIKAYPEADKGQWFGIEEAREKILRGQVEFLERLMQTLFRRQ
ncbi:MAG: NUDIX domain-containing protein [Thiohalobacteraceae bacterium]